MKEVEDVKVFPDVFSSMSAKAKIYKVKELYNQCKTIEEKVDYIIQVTAYSMALIESGINPEDGIRDALGAINDDFLTRYIDNGSHEEHKRVFYAFGKNKWADYDAQMVSKNFYAGGIFKGDKDAGIKAGWLAKTLQECFNIQAIGQMQANLMTYFGADEARDREIDGLNLDSKTTMKDVALYIGYNENDINQFFDKYKNAFGPETRVMEYYSKLKNKKEDELTLDEIKLSLGDLIVSNEKYIWLSDSRKKYFKEHGHSDEYIKEIIELGDKPLEGYLKGDLKKWGHTEGKEKVNKDITIFINRTIKTFNKNYLETNAVHLQPSTSTKYTDIYDSLKTIEEKIDYIVSVGQYVASKNRLGEPFLKAERNEINNLTNKFISEYILSNNINNYKKTFQVIGKLLAKNNIEMVRDENEFLAKADPDDPNRNKKARYVARSSKSGIYYSALAAFATQVRRSYLAEDDAVLTTIWNSVDLKDDTNMYQLAHIAGLKDKQVDMFLEKFKTYGDTNVNEYFRDRLAKAGNKDISNEDVNVEILKTLREYMMVSWRDNASEREIKKENYTEEERKKYEDIKLSKAKELSSGSIQSWIEGEGAKFLDDLSDNAALMGKEEFGAKYLKDKSYERYIILHTGVKARDKQPEELNDMLSKAMAAYILKDTKAEFDLDRIHTMAENIKIMPKFSEITMDSEKVKDYLKRDNSLSEAVRDVVNSTYVVPEDQLNNYVDRMKKLSDSMLSSKGRSKEYKAFYNAVSKIGELSNKYDINHEVDRGLLSKEIVDLNAKLIDSIRVYTKGKKNVRLTDNGKERFNLNLDALSIINDCIPGAKKQVDKLANRVNDVRWKSNNINISDYGEKRAVKAKAARDEKKKGDKAPNKQNPVM